MDHPTGSDDSRPFDRPDLACGELGAGMGREVIKDRYPLVLVHGKQLAEVNALNTQGTFTEPQTSRDAITTLQDITSPVSAFVRDRCVVGPAHEITTDELWEAWKLWCEDNGRRAGTKALFGRDLFAAYPMIKKSRPRDNDARVHIYEGIQVGI